jgi:hypothetical protein
MVPSAWSGGQCLGVHFYGKVKKNASSIKNGRATPKRYFTYFPFLVARGLLRFIHVKSILKQMLFPRNQKLHKKFGIFGCTAPHAGNSNPYMLALAKGIKNFLRVLSGWWYRVMLL